MEIYHHSADIIVFGHLLKTFPLGVPEAFGALMKTIADGHNRSYYGLSEMNKNNKVLYWVAAEEKFEGEAEKYGYERYIIPRGEYLAVAVHNWRANTDCIKDVFQEMLQDARADKTKQCIEWYKTDEEMLCMIQIDTIKQLIISISKEADELLALLLPLNEDQINAVPFEGSWTAAQLARHIIKSNIGIAQALEMPGIPAQRNPAEKVQGLKDTFLNFDHKMQSPGFIVPEEGPYKKEIMIASLKKSNEQLIENSRKANPNDMINLPAAFGEITKLELLHFVVYHTSRHIHQLKNIRKHI